MAVSWRRDSAEERLVIEVERSRRRSEVEVSISVRAASVRLGEGGSCGRGFLLL